jgi:hypothetical protein
MTWWESFKFKRMRKKLEYEMYCNGLGSNHLWHKVKAENDRLGVWKKGRVSHVTGLEE